MKKQPVESLCMVPQAVICEQTPASPAVAEPLALVEKSDVTEISGTRLPVDQTEARVSANSPGTHELVDAIPDYSNNPLPEYPPLARQRQWQGVVWLLVDVSDEGLVENLNVEQSCGHSVLDRAASRAVKNWHFTPARRAGIPTASQVRIPVRFSLEES
ncbi:MAG: energy transducer TonB [Desulfuromonadales bacterium]